MYAILRAQRSSHIQAKQNNKSYWFQLKLCFVSFKWKWIHRMESKQDSIHTLAGSLIVTHRMKSTAQYNQPIHKWEVTIVTISLAFACHIRFLQPIPLQEKSITNLWLSSFFVWALWKSETSKWPPFQQRTTTGQQYEWWNLFMD